MAMGPLRVAVLYCFGLTLVSNLSSAASVGHVCDSSLLPSNASYDAKLYNDDNNIWLNPGRGFYHKLMTSSRSTDFDTIKETALDCWRGRDGTTLLLRLYLLDDLSGAPLDQDFINNIRQDMATVQEAGWNVVLRFMYNTWLDATYNTQTSEPAIDRILYHIVQLRQIFHDFEGIIVAIQAGFLGESGLWYEPNNSGSAPSNASYTQLLDALFQNVPSSIPIQVPRPEYKQRYVGQTSTSPFDVITLSNKLRVGFFHECLLGGDTNHLINAFPRFNASTLSNTSYISADTKYSIMGGRTCHPGDTRNGPDLCSDSMELFEKIHMTYLDIEDPDETLKYYRQHNCFNTVRQRLGYQLLLHTVDLPTAAYAGKLMCIHVTLVNKGFATPARNVDIFIVLQLNSTIVYRVDLSVNKALDKLWQPGLAEIPLVTKTFHLADDMPPGQYKVYLAIADSRQQNDSNYYILLGGEYNGQPTADPTNGLNFIGEVQILQSSSSSVPSSSLTQTSDTVQTWSLPVPSTHLRKWSSGYTPQSCAALPHGKPSPTTLPTTSSVSQTTRPSHQFDRYKTCDELEVTKALLQYTYFNSSLALPCPDTNPHSSESILQRFCKAPSASRWVPVNAVKVIEHCDEIPKFTPVAFFKSLLGVSLYDRGLNGGMAGVFFGCVKKNGVFKSVKIGIQLCGFPFDVALIHPGDVDLQSLYIVNTL